MSEKLRESISALMDGEADELELRRLLSSDNEDAVSQTWSRYHLARDVMQNDQQDTSFRHLDISRQVSLAISEGEGAAEESVGSTLTDLARSSAVVSPAWWRPVAGFAVAASVAVAVVFTVQSAGLGTSGLNNSVGQPVIASSASSVGAITVSSSRVYPQTIQSQGMGGMQASGEIVSYQGAVLPSGVAASRAAADLEAQKRLEKYILRHTESAALNNGQGMISFARVANFEAE